MNVKIKAILNFAPFLIVLATLYLLYLLILHENIRLNFFHVNMNDESNDSGAKCENSEEETKEKQLARCFLRERFLRAVAGVVGKECTFHMYPNTKVQGIFRGNDIEFENLLVEKLKTPFAEIPYSKIRSMDVNYLEFKNFQQ